MFRILAQLLWTTRTLTYHKWISHLVDTYWLTVISFRSLHMTVYFGGKNMVAKQGQSPQSRIDFLHLANETTINWRRFQIMDSFSVGALVSSSSLKSIMIVFKWISFNTFVKFIIVCVCEGGGGLLIIFWFIMIYRYIISPVQIFELLNLRTGHTWENEVQLPK